MFSKHEKLLTSSRCVIIVNFFFLLCINYCHGSTENSLEVTTSNDITDPFATEWASSSYNSHEIEFCPKHEYNRTCCNEGEFQCATGSCISKHKLCDISPDCPDNSDEYGCVNVDCLHRGPLQTCSQTCENTGRNKSRCTCFRGFALNKIDGRSCIDINECEIGVHWCSQMCLNLNGTFQCSCLAGFEKNEDLFKGSCKAVDTNIQILYSSDAWIYSYSSENHKVSPIVHAGRVDEMDIDPNVNMVYWSTRHRVGRSYLPGATNGEVTIGYPQSIGSSSIWHIKNSLAIDWMARNLYWISVNILNINKFQILVSKLDGRYVKTVVDDVTCATSLVVDPENGKMYWTSGGDKAEIGSAWMNGMYRKPVAFLANSKHPIALTLDHNSPRRLYWSDSDTNSIYMIYTDGTSPKKIITLGEADAPLKMDVFENYLYWITKGSGKLIKSDKFGRGHMKTLVEKLINQTAIKVYHPKRVEVDIRKEGLRCEQHLCSHLCLHVPKGYSCSCPDGSKLLIQNGEILCNTEKEFELEEPLICNCNLKAKVCNTSLPEHRCHCPGVKCEDDVTQSADYDDATFEPEVSDYEGNEIVDRHDNLREWMSSLIFFICVIPVLICFGLSFFKKSEEDENISRTDNASNPVVFNNQDVSMTCVYAQGGPTIVKSDQGPQSTNNGFDNTSFFDDQPDLSSSTQHLVL